MTTPLQTVPARERLHGGGRWRERLRSGLCGLALLAACEHEAARAPAAAPVHEAIAPRATDAVRVSVVWEGNRPEFLAALEQALDGAEARQAWARWNSQPDSRVLIRGARALELDFDSAPAALDAALDLLAAATEQALSPAAQAQAAADDAAAPESDWRRRTALELEAAQAGDWRWHASALASSAAREQVERALSDLEARVARFAWPGANAAAAQADVVLIESSASAPSELRWIARAERAPLASPAERALDCASAAALAASLPGWTFIPAGVDAWGRREPAYLYASGELGSGQQRLRELRAALGAPLPVASVAAARLQRASFARAQLSREEFCLHALHGNQLERFEQDAAALEQLKLGDAPLTPAAQGSRWAVCGPPEAWLESLALLGPVTTIELPAAATQDSAERELARMWTALGGSAPWSALKSLRLLSVIHIEATGSANGVEQWIDFESGRFALAQAVRDQETVVVATAAEAWLLDGSSGVDLTDSQARKLRLRQERILFVLLQRLAQPDRGGLAARLVGQRLELSEQGRELCWLELDSAGLPARLGYRLEDESEDSLYEFQDWNLDGPLPYPARTRQVDRQAVQEFDFVGPDAPLDAALWQRKAR